MTEHKFQIKDELKLIPGMAIGLAIAVFAAIQVLVHFVLSHTHNPPPAPLRVFFGLFAGGLLAMFFLLWGYVYRDAKRRGMNPLLWLMIVVLVPNALGFLVYFLVRSEVIGKCPNCGAMVRNSFNFCPKCNHALVPVCPHCRHTIGAGDMFCPYCGKEVGARA